MDTNVDFISLQQQQQQQQQQPTTNIEIDRDYIESESSQCKIDDWHYEMRRDMQEVLVCFNFFSLNILVIMFPLLKIKTKRT